MLHDKYVYIYFTEETIVESINLVYSNLYYIITGVSIRKQTESVLLIVHNDKYLYFLLPNRSSDYSMDVHGRYLAYFFSPKR